MKSVAQRTSSPLARGRLRVRIPSARYCDAWLQSNRIGATRFCIVDLRGLHSFPRNYAIYQRGSTRDARFSRRVVAHLSQPLPILRPKRLRDGAMSRLAGLGGRGKLAAQMCVRTVAAVTLQLAPW